MKSGEAIEKVAQANGRSVEEVRTEMEAAIQEGLSSTDPKVKEFWAQVPCEGEIPTPEEYIEFLAQISLEEGN